MGKSRGWVSGYKGRVLLLVLTLLLAIAQPAFGFAQTLKLPVSQTENHLILSTRGNQAPEKTAEERTPGLPILPSRAEVANRRLGPFYFLDLPLHLFSLAISALVGLGLLRWRPSFLPQLATTTSEMPAQVAAWGLVGTAVIVFLNLLSLLILAVAPLFSFLDGIAFLGILLGRLGGYLWLGQQLQLRVPVPQVQRICKKIKPTELQFLLGLTLVGSVGLVPILGNLLLLPVNFWGLGTILVWQVDRGRWQTPAPGS